MKLDLIKREALGELERQFYKAFRSRPEVDAIFLRERMKAAVVEACGSRRADELFPEQKVTIRRPQQYTRNSGWMA